MENAKTLIKVRESDYETVCDFFKEHDVIIGNTVQERKGEPIYLNLCSPIGLIKPLFNEIENLIVGNPIGC